MRHLWGQSEAICGGRTSGVRGRYISSTTCSWPRVAGRQMARPGVPTRGDTHPPKDLQVTEASSASLMSLMSLSVDFGVLRHPFRPSVHIFIVKHVTRQATKARQVTKRRVPLRLNSGTSGVILIVL